MGGPEKINYCIDEMHFGGTEMVLGVRKWPNPIILKNGDGIFPLRGAEGASRGNKNSL